MGSLYERNGVYYASFYDSTRTPSNLRFSLRTESKREAKRMLRKLHEPDIDPWGEDPVGEVCGGAHGRILSDVIEDFAKHKRRTGRKESTISKYEGIWRRFMEACGGETTALSEIGPEAVRDYVYAEHVNLHTSESRYRAVKTIFRHEGHEEKIEPITKPSPGERMPRAVRPNELLRICEAAIEDYREKRGKWYIRPREIIWCLPAFKFAFLTGLRGSELGRVRWRHIDLRRKTLKVLQQKNNKEQQVPLLDEAAEMLEEMKTPSERQRYYVFRSPSAPKTDRSARRFREHLGRRFAKYRDEAGVREILTLHSLRHGFATRLAENGASAHAIKNAMRHADVRTSQIYVHMAGNDLKREMEDAFSGNI